MTNATLNDIFAYLDASHHRCRLVFRMCGIARWIPEATPHLLRTSCLCCSNDANQFTATAIIKSRENEKFESRAVDQLPGAIGRLGVRRIRRQRVLHAGRQQRTPRNRQRCTSVFGLVRGRLCTTNRIACNEMNIKHLNSFISPIVPTLSLLYTDRALCSSSRATSDDFA